MLNNLSDERTKYQINERQDDGTIPATDLAIPFFSYKSHISIDRKFRLIPKWKATDAALKPRHKTLNQRVKNTKSEERGVK